MNVLIFQRARAGRCPLNDIKNTCIDNKFREGEEIFERKLAPGRSLACDRSARDAGDRLVPEGLRGQPGR